MVNEYIILSYQDKYDKIIQLLAISHQQSIDQNRKGST